MFSNDSLNSEYKKMYLSEWESSQILEYQLKQYGIEYHYLRGMASSGIETDTVVATTSMEESKFVTHFLANNPTRIYIPKNKTVEATYLLNSNALTSDQVVDKDLKLRVNNTASELIVNYKGSITTFKIKEDIEKIIPNLKKGSKVNSTITTHSVENELLIFSQGNIQLQFMDLPISINHNAQNKVENWNIETDYNTLENSLVIVVFK